MNSSDPQNPPLSFSRQQRALIVLVLLPTLLAGIYLTFIHSPMYISETRFALRSSDSADLPSITGMIFQTSSSTTMDAYVVQDYIASPDMLEIVKETTPFLEHYASTERDPFSRLKANHSREELLKYWHNIVMVKFNQDQGIITVSVKAYSPETSREINRVIVDASENLVNRMNYRSHQDSLRLTQEEVNSAEKRLLNAQAALQQFRDDRSILDPLTTAQGLETVIAQLESEAASTQAELTALLGIMNPDSTRVVSIRNKLNALHEQLGKERARLAGLDSKQGTLSSLVGDYAQLTTEEHFAQEQYIKAMSAYEVARLKAISQSRYIVPFQQPTLPQESIYPRPFLYTLFIGAALLVLLGILSLLIAAIKDHMGV